MTDGEKRRRTIWVPDPLWKAVRTKGRRLGLSNSHIVRRLLENWVKRD